MKLKNQLKAAIRSLSKNKMRTFLTMLGIIIGVASVIAMLAIGQGSKESIQAQISNLGTNLLTIFPSASMTGGVRMEAGTSVRMTIDDYKAVASRCPAVMYSTPTVRTSGQLIAGSQNWRTSVWGVYPDYFNIRNLEVQSGAVFTTAEDHAATKICVIGQTVSKYLFGEGIDPVGKQVRVNKIPFMITGLLTAKGQNAFGQDQDDIVIAPFTTVQERMMTITYINSIMVSATSEKMIPEATDEITQVLKERHHLGQSEDPDFTIRSQADIANAATATSGILNIMLVSVTERTREIGIRMGVGARGRDVLLQFLIEALMISLIGGILGVGLGILTSEVIASIMKWPVTITLQSIILSFLFSTAIGIFFGWYPARKAASLNPIDALRYE